MNWTAYEFGGHVVTDYEDNVCGTNDWTHGQANVSPTNVDLASYAGNDTPCDNPGPAPTLQYDEDDNYLYFRVRLVDNPQQKTGSLYNSYHWDVLVETNGDEYSDYVIDMFGTADYLKDDYPQTPVSSVQGVLGIYPNNYSLTPPDEEYNYTYNPDNPIWQAHANRMQNYYTRVVSTDGSTYPGQWWIDMAIPKIFEDESPNPISSYNALFASTSASNINPLQKDWMGAEGFFTEIVKTKSVENLTNPDYTTVAMPAKPGDELRYTLTAENIGNI